MNLAVEQLAQTETALRKALSEGDWPMIASLDQQCREAVEAAMVEPQDTQALRTRLEELLGLYKQLVELCQSEQRRLAGELVQLNHSQQGAKVYQLFG